MRFPSSITVRLRALRKAPLQARLCGGDGIVEQHGARHRADPSGDGRDPGRLGFDLVEADVPDESPLFFAVDADVDDDYPIPDVFGPDHLPAACRDDEDVSPPGDFWKVARSRVADRDGRVLAQQ